MLYVTSGDDRRDCLLIFNPESEHPCKLPPKSSTVSSLHLQPFPAELRPHPEIPCRTRVQARISSQSSFSITDAESLQPVTAKA